MKKIISLPLLCVLSLTLFMTSCKKSSADSTNNGGSSNLGAGKSSIAFTSNASFAGNTSFSQSNTAYTSAGSVASGVLRNIVLSASEVSGVNARTVALMIITPSDASTASGNLVSDFSLPGTPSIIPTLTLTSNSGTTQGITYGAESGTCTITKLTATEIEGTFSAVVKDVNGTGTLTLSSGTFAGKFQ